MILLIEYRADFWEASRAGMAVTAAAKKIAEIVGRCGQHDSVDCI